MKLRLPQPADAPWLLLAAGIWVGILVTIAPGMGTVGAGLIAAILFRWKSKAAVWIAVGSLAAGLASGLLVTERRHDRVDGSGSANRVSAEMIVTSDVIIGSFDDVVVARAVAVVTASSSVRVSCR